MLLFGDAFLENLGLLIQGIGDTQVERVRIVEKEEVHETDEPVDEERIPAAACADRFEYYPKFGPARAFDELESERSPMFSDLIVVIFGCWWAGL